MAQMNGSTSSSSSCYNCTMPAAVCVTGAGGYIASWLVKLLLLKGYRVHGTVRNPDDPKNSHLRSFRGASERLTLHKADLLDQDGSLHDAFLGCHGLFHVASPISNDPVRVRDAVEGTKNVMRAAAESRIRRVVFTSSIGAVHMNPNRSPDQILDESCWSDLEFCKNTKNWYCYGKMMAERVAMLEAERTGMKLMVMVPPVVMGPMLHPSNNSTAMRLVDYMIGLKKSYPNIVQGYVDVRDVARAHLLVYETPEASGRYLCIESVLHHSQILGILGEMFPNYPITSRSGEETANGQVKPFKFSIQRLRNLGFDQFIPIKQSLYETVKFLQERGHMPLPLPSTL